MSKSVRSSCASHAARQKAHYLVATALPSSSMSSVPATLTSSLLRAVERNYCAKFWIVEMLESRTVHAKSLPLTLEDLEMWKETVKYEEKSPTVPQAYVSLHAVRSALYQLLGNTETFRRRYDLTLRYLASVSFQVDLLTYSCLLLKPAVTPTLLRMRSMPEVADLPRFYGAWLLLCRAWLAVQGAEEEVARRPCACGEREATMKSACCIFCEKCYWKAQKGKDRASCRCGADLDLYFLVGRERPKGEGLCEISPSSLSSLEKFRRLPLEVTAKEVRNTHFDATGSSLYQHHSRCRFGRTGRRGRQSRCRSRGRSWAPPALHKTRGPRSG